jgi:hypothetical protein
VHIGGSARSYQGLSARLAISTTDEQAGAQTVFLCMAARGMNARFCRGQRRWRGQWFLATDGDEVREAIPIW